MVIKKKLKRIYCRSRIHLFLVSKFTMNQKGALVGIDWLREKIKIFSKVVSTQNKSLFPSLTHIINKKVFYWQKLYLLKENKAQTSKIIKCKNSKNILSLRILLRLKQKAPKKFWRSLNLIINNKNRH